MTKYALITGGTKGSEDLMVSGPAEGAAVLRELLHGKGPRAMREMLALNIGFGLHLLHPERPMEACMAEAVDALAKGAGGAFLRRLVAEQEADRSRENDFLPAADDVTGSLAGGGHA